MCISCTPAAAVKFCKTVSAFFLGVYIAVFKSIPDIRPCNPFVHISHPVFLIPYKLMTGIQITPGRNCQILCPGTASGQPFGHTWSSGQIQHKMKECKCFPGAVPTHHLRRQPIIFCKHFRQFLHF